VSTKNITTQNTSNPLHHILQRGAIPWYLFVDSKSHCGYRPHILEMKYRPV